MSLSSLARVSALMVAMSLGSACTQYKPQGSLTSLGKSQVGLVPTACYGKQEVYKISEGSSVTWQLETIKPDGSGDFIGSTHRASGLLGTIQGKLKESTAEVTFNLQDLATKDVARDRILRDVLFSDGGTEFFRLILDQIDTQEKAVGAGNSKELRMVARLDIGHRIAPVIFNADVSEKDGIYHAKGGVELTTRNTNVGINAITLKDRIEKLQSMLKIEFSNTLRLDMDLFLKKDCQ